MVVVSLMTMFAGALSLHQPTYHGCSDSLMLWRCIGVAQVWRSHSCLNNMHLLIFVLAFFLLTLSMTWIGIKLQGAGHVLAVELPSKSR